MSQYNVQLQDGNGPLALSTALTRIETLEARLDAAGA